MDLIDKIKKAKQDYYAGQASVTDKVYDSWIAELEKIDPNHEELTSVGSFPVSEWKKHTHTTPMGSLNKVNSFHELKSWADKFCTSPFLTHKLDGLSLCLIYDNGKLIQAVTRGSGEIGEDIFQNALKVPNIPKTISTKTLTHVRGELMFNLENFSKFKDVYSNPRNAASGISRRYDGTNCEELSFYAYEFLNDEFVLTTEVDLFNHLHKIGFSVPDYTLFASIEDAEDFRNALDRSSLPYEIDGLVIRENDITKQKSFGIVSSRPKGAIAYKFEADGFETTITSIDFQVGSTGVITPVAYFNPIEVEGVIVKKCSLYNMDYINRLKLNVGSSVLVIRANGVIPRIEECISSTGTILAPTHCPECNSPVVVSGSYLKCSDTDNCLKSNEQKIIKYLHNMNILEWGDKLVHSLFESQLVNKISDLYFLTEDQLASLPRMGKKSAQSCLHSINSSKSVSLSRFLGSIGIPGVSESTIKLLVESGYDSFEKISNVTSTQLFEIKGLGEVKSNAILSFFETSFDEAQLIANQLNITTAKPSSTKSSNQIFCFTGEFDNRKALEKLVTDMGGTVKSAVTKSTTYLVTNDPTSSSSKNTKARELNIPILNESQFKEMMGNV